MVEFTLPKVLTEGFLKGIPAQRAMVDQMMSTGKIKSYSLTSDRSRLWVVMKAESEFEIMETIAQFPLVDYMEPDVQELAFHNTQEHVLQFSLN
ncbi:MAG: hypothetical protein KDC34_08215 [Saprospiraceae bacterium]|nr:hypothetical protein [Saprospiraceae bacterium]